MLTFLALFYTVQSKDSILICIPTNSRQYRIVYLMKIWTLDNIFSTFKCLKSSSL